MAVFPVIPISARTNLPGLQQNRPRAAAPYKYSESHPLKGARVYMYPAIDIVTTIIPPAVGAFVGNNRKEVTGALEPVLRSVWAQWAWKGRQDQVHILVRDIQSTFIIHTIIVTTMNLRS